MRMDGFWQITYVAPKGPPVIGILVFHAGIVIGADAFGGVYEGSYVQDEEFDGLVLKLMATTSIAGPYVVVGGPSLKAGRTFSVRGVLQDGRETALLHTDGGPITVTVKKLRDFPAGQLPKPAAPELEPAD
ncbi:hypothetical protein [Acidisoma cladoniae]|uniref:hypothetical protein n=1 Tax=Acidisoma cladoniae TaxID=3040935 RepID=UPI00254B9255|nr:hypothetical protein [Acidisoma sp. PAMC 29798]